LRSITKENVLELIAYGAGLWIFLSKVVFGSIAQKWNQPEEVEGQTEVSEEDADQHEEKDLLQTVQE
jgi:hypothetical protein